MAFENLRPFLLEIPLLSQAIEAELSVAPPVSANSDDIRKAYEAATARAFDFLKAENLPYAIITYPEYLGTCPECGEEVPGAYWELNNPKGRGTSVPFKALHVFVEHGKLEYLEPITNLAGTVIGHHPLGFDVAAVKQVLAGIPLPPEVEADLQVIA